MMGDLFHSIPQNYNRKDGSRRRPDPLDWIIDLVIKWTVGGAIVLGALAYVWSWLRECF